MKKISLMILVVIILQIVLPIFTILNNSIFTLISQAETNYSSIDLNTLEEIKDDLEALSQVSNINVTSHFNNDNEKIIQQLDLVRLCPNIEYIYICANGLNLDKNFFNSLSSTKEITISIQWGSVNFEGISNSNITTLYLSQNKIYNFQELENLVNLKELVTDAVDGFGIIDFEKLNNLESIRLTGQRIEDYEEFFAKIKNVKILSLDCCNLQDSDTSYMKNITELQELNLNGTFVNDITFLKDLPKLKGVTLPLGISNLEVLYEMPYLDWVSFDGYTETNIDNNLVNFFEENNISYPNFDRNIKNKVNTIIESFNFTENTTEYEKIEKVTEYVLKNMKCDQGKLNEIISSEGEGKATTLDFDINYGYGVCHWYSILEYTLLKLVGIDAYYVEGYAIFSENDSPGSHAWNMVRVDENWYGIDSLWIDDDNNDPTTPEYKNSIWRRYYLKYTKIDDLNDWPQYGDQEEYMDKYFALYHRTFNNPQDTITNTINVIEIDVTTYPVKTTYIQNYENLDLAGGILTITYNDKTTDTISLTNENVHTNGFDNTKIGINTITVEYEGKTTTFDVQIISKQAVGIEVTTLPTKNQYIQNYEILDLAGGILTITYNDKTTDTISLTNENVHTNGFDNTKIGTNTITVEYEGKTTTFDIQILSKQITGIEVSKLPTKTKYIQNYENLDLTGGIITIVYNDKSTDNMDITNKNVKVSNFDNTVLGKNTLIVEYNGIKTNFDVEIVSKSVIKIELTTNPVKTRYIQNTETIDLTGGIITVTYNDKTTDTMSLTNEKLHITGFNNSQVGNNTLTIEYEGVKTSFSIEIISNNTEESETKDKPTKDDTLAVGTLPQTGERTIIFIVSIIGSFILVITLYKKIKKYNNI